MGYAFCTCLCVGFPDLSLEYVCSCGCCGVDTGANRGEVPSTCSCVDPDCQDDTSFIDEKGYFCDTWVGDDCSKAQESWGYSAAGQQAALTRCRRSCGQCTMLSPCPSTKRCVGTERFSANACRACRTDKVSGIDIQGSLVVE